MKKGKLISVILLMLFFVITSQQNGYAKSVSEAINEEGDIEEIAEFDDGSLWLSIFDGKTGDLIFFGEIGNPNPDGDSGGSKPTPDSIKEMVKRYYKGKLSKGVQLNNPFATKQSSRGKGLAPRWNPSGEAKEYEGSGGGSGPGTNSGGSGEWVKSMARKGASGEDDEGNNSGNSGDKPELGTTGSIQPERINPIPTLSGASHERKSLNNSKNRLTQNRARNKMKQRMTAHKIHLQALRKVAERRATIQKKKLKLTKTKKRTRKQIAANNPTFKNKPAVKTKTRKISKKKKTFRNKKRVVSERTEISLVDNRMQLK